MLKKMTPKTVMGEKIKAPEESTKIFTIFGIASGVKKGESTYGLWTMLTGTFEAIKDGERFISTVCALPQPLHDLIVDAVNKSDGADVQFACDVILAPADNVIGYEYFAQSLVEQAENDPLAGLRNTVNEKLAIEAPKKAATPKDEKPGKEKPAKEKA